MLTLILILALIISYISTYGCCVISVIIEESKCRLLNKDEESE
jgi:hypothetical protein